VVTSPSTPGYTAAAARVHPEPGRIRYCPYTDHPYTD
jgi:hypothetical protein